MTAALRAPGPLRVLVVDDSAVIRGMLGKWLAEEADLELVGAAASAEEALRRLAGCAADLCVLDVELPGMSGLEALPRLLAARPGLKVIVASGHSAAGAGTSLKAMAQGAADFLAKPAARDPDGARQFRRDLFARLRALGARPAPGALPERPRGAAPLPRLRPRPDLIVIGASTGGPPALTQVLTRMAAWLDAPVAVVQHMPAAFTPILARNLAQETGLPVSEAVEGAALGPRQVLIAPGGRHLRVRRGPEGLCAALDDGPPENFCRPSVDPLFASAAEVCGDRLVAAVLTGMGADGREGARAVVRRGGLVVAQDAATSVVWGMPGAVVEAGLAEVVAPLGGIADVLGAAFRGARR